MIDRPPAWCQRSSDRLDYKAVQGDVIDYDEYLTGERIVMTTGAAVGIRSPDMSQRGGRVLWKE